MPKNKPALLVLLPLILSACASAPNVDPRPAVQSAKPPPLVREALGPSFLDQMQVFLSGKLPAQIPSVTPSTPATKPTKQ